MDKNIVALWLMSPMIGIVAAGAAYLLFLFRDNTYYFAIPFLMFVVGIIYLQESRWDKKTEAEEQCQE
jgi:phosphate/sulfate permease